MNEKPLFNFHILVAEDDYLLAAAVREILTDAGAVVVGPAPNVVNAASLIEKADRIDAAVLDVNLGGEMVYPIADILRANQVPIILTTGYDAQSLKADYADIRICEKPFDPQQLVSELTRLIPSA
ncbi:MAG: response regulator [Sphingomonadaceae bacterium]|nr:response regulator [Sphingomonadaceae bacterium]